MRILHLLTASIFMTAPCLTANAQTPPAAPSAPAGTDAAASAESPQPAASDKDLGALIQQLVPPPAAAKPSAEPAKQKDSAKATSNSKKAPDKKTQSDAEANPNDPDADTKDLAAAPGSYAARANTLDADAEMRAAAAAYYAANPSTQLWVSPKGLNAKGTAAVAEIKNAADWGLEPRAFAVPELSAASDGTSDLPREQLARAEVDLTLAVLTYANHARGGRIADPAKQLSSFVDRLPQLYDPRVVLADIAKADDPAAYLRGLHPKHPQFEKLRQRYLELRRDASAADAVVRIPSGPLLKPGMNHPHVAMVRQRLAVPAATGADETLFDPALVDAVKSFQKEKGANPDGYVGNATRAAFNDVEEVSTERVLANMEAFRWLPDDLGNFYVTVNIPEFMMRVVKAGEVIHEERVIVGLPDKQTPVFSDEMELVTFHPRWNVPQSIKVRELYPSLARGSSSFKRQGLRMSYRGRPVDPENVDWYSADIRRYDVYQPPGAGNVLGMVKFSFPNKHLVYMHDTSTRGLFEAPSRPFSHGCIRVRNPERFAEIVLGEANGLDAVKIEQMINSNPVEKPITLDRKVPVHVTYSTVVIGADGKETLFKDVYGHEKRIMQALEGKWDQIARGPDHLAPVKYTTERYTGGGNALEIFVNNFFGGF